MLLGKMGESNKFIREDADKALEVMVNSVSPARALAALIACGVRYGFQKSTWIYIAHRREAPLMRYRFL